MTTVLETRLEIKSWDEKPYREFDDGRKFTRADVVLAGTGDGVEGEATWEALMFYAADGTSTYVAIMHLTGRLGGRSGSAVWHGTGTYDGTRALSTLTVADGSGTGELAGLRGTAVSVSTHADYPFMPMTLRYELE